MDLKEAQDVLWNALYELDPTGAHGCEGFLAAALCELTNQFFHVVKSGAQGGSDVRSDPGNLVRIALESKQYGQKTVLTVDGLLYKLTEASTAVIPPDLWVLASTREIDSADREKLQKLGDQLGVGILVWDWKNVENALCDLAVVCGSAPNSCQLYLDRSPELNEALEVIRTQGDFELRASIWRKRLEEPDVGYASARQECHVWLKDAQSSLINAKSRLGGHFDLGANEGKVVRRSSINSELGEWFSDRSNGIAALVGDEGMGKSWAALDWCDALLHSLGSASPIVVFVPARLVKGSDSKSDIASLISIQTGSGSDQFWRRRLELWERSNRENVRILVILDGLNQNFMHRDWADWAQPLLEDSLKGMYRLLVTCWRSFWRDELLGLSNLEPKPFEISVTGYDDEELETLLKAMDIRREELAHELLPLMRVPRLSAVALGHREALAESGDITAERVIYEDWKDRIRRSGNTTGLNDDRMKEFIREIGWKLREDFDREVSRRNILEILAHKSGKGGEELQAAVAQLTSGGWFKAKGRPDTFELEPDRVHYVLGAALVSQLKNGYGSAGMREVIAKFLDPLKAHSLGAKILRAATTIALVEADTAEELKQELLRRWLDEQNFSSNDFDALWRLAGLDASLFLSVAELEWLGAALGSFKDEVLIKMLANAAEFTSFERALKARLIEWLGSVWNSSNTGLNQHERGHGIEFAPEGEELEPLELRFERWLKSGGYEGFVPIRLREEGNWGFLSHRAISVISYIARSPISEAFEAWSLSRAVMGHPKHIDILRWTIRLNLVDLHEAYDVLDNVVAKFERHQDTICTQAAKFLRKAMSHVSRVEPMCNCDEVPQSCNGNIAKDKFAELEAEALFDAVGTYFRPEGWKSLHASEGAKLVDRLIELGLADSSKGIDFISDHFRELVTIISPESRRLLRDALEEATDSVYAEDESNLIDRLSFMALLLRLLDASAKEQSNLLLASNCSSFHREWCGVFLFPQLEDLEGLDTANATESGLKQWLECVGARLTRPLIQSLEFLPSLVTHDIGEVRHFALLMATEGLHEEALNRFVESKYAAPPDSGNDETRFLEEYSRNKALVKFESISPGTIHGHYFANESAALRVNQESVSECAWDKFGEYLVQELKAVAVSSEWSTRRYWDSYIKCVKSLFDRSDRSFIEHVANLALIAAQNAEHATMTDFPVLDTMKAVKEAMPHLALAIYQRLAERLDRSITSSRVIDGFPFELPQSESSDILCKEQLVSAFTEKKLLDIAYFCYKNGRVGWLMKQIAVFEESCIPSNVARAFTLLGCCDANPESDKLWREFSLRPPGDEWLRRVFCESRKDYRRNLVARKALKEFWQEESDAVARHRWKLFEQECDRRIDLWFEEYAPEVGKGPTKARELARNLGVRGVNNAVRKDLEKRKKRLFHTPIPQFTMSPWR